MAPQNYVKLKPFPIIFIPISRELRLLLQIAPAKSAVPVLEFLVVGNHANAFRILTEVIRDVQGRLNCASSAGAAMDYLARRKADGIVIDMGIPGAIDLMACVRT